MSQPHLSSHPSIDPVIVRALHDLNAAEGLIDKAVYDLAEKTSSELVGKLIVLTGELDRVIEQLSFYANPVQ